jgi:FkbM family methyltransferase
MKDFKFNYLKKLIDKDKVTIVEIGSHWGQDTVRFVQKFKNVIIHSFEPNPVTVKINKSLIESVMKRTKMVILNKPLEYEEAKIFLYNFAISDKNGYTDFHCTYREPRESDKKHTERNLVGNVNFHYDDFVKPYVIAADGSSLNKIKGNDLYKTIKVQTKTLDDWLSDVELDHVDLMWIDVQGHEKNVIKGAKEALKKVDYVIMETGEQNNYENAMSQKETIQLMKTFSFKHIRNFGNDSLFGREK